MVLVSVYVRGVLFLEYFYYFGQVKRHAPCCQPLTICGLRSELMLAIYCYLLAGRSRSVLRFFVRVRTTRPKHEKQESKSGSDRSPI